MKLKDIQKRPSMLIMGPSGSGKTHFLGTMAQKTSLILVTADPDGIDTLRKMDIPDKNLEIILVEDWKKAPSYIDEIEGLSKQYNTLAIDDLGAVQRKAKGAIEEQPRRDEEKATEAKRSKYIRDQQLVGKRKMLIDQWGALYTAMFTFIAEAMELSYKMRVVTVLEAKDQHPRTGEDHLYPDLGGGIRTDLTSLFSLVVNTFVQKVDDENYFCMTSKQHPKIETKTRYGIPRTWVNPTYQRIVNHIIGGELEEPETALEIAIGTGTIKEVGEQQKINVR